MQNYERLYSYIYEYWKHLYDVYSLHGIAYLTTYYHVNVNRTVWDNEKLSGGAYEKIGDLSGIMWDRYLLLPVYFVTELDQTFDGQDIGYVNEGGTQIVIPYSYGFVPLPMDLFKFDQHYLFNNESHDIYSLFVVDGVRKQAQADKTYWQLTCDVYRSKTITDLEDHQVADSYAFFDYDKKLHSINDSISLTHMMSKSSDIRDRLKQLYDPNSGFYFI